MTHNDMVVAVKAKYETVTKEGHRALWARIKEQGMTPREALAAATTLWLVAQGEINAQGEFKLAGPSYYFGNDYSTLVEEAYGLLGVLA